MSAILFLTLFGWVTGFTQTNYHFNHTVTTSASPERVWEIWTDVENWKAWDSGLKNSSLKGSFKVGAHGTIVPDKGPKSKFIISALDSGKTYTFKAKIPFGWLIVRRTLNLDDHTSFTHDVEFTGLLKKPLGRKIGKRYRAMLPQAMENIKKLAEESQ